MNRAIGQLLVFLVGGGLVALAGYGGLLPGLQRSGSTPTGGAGSRTAKSVETPKGTVVALAKLQPAGGVLELGGIPGDRIKTVAVRPGQLVHQNDPLLTFDSVTLRQIELDAADTQYREADARLKAEQSYSDALLAEAKVGLDRLALDELELTAQTTRMKSLQQQAEAAQRNHERIAKLSKDLTSPQQLDQAKLQHDQAQNEFLAAQELIKKLTEGNALKRREAEAKRDQAIAGRARVDAMVPLKSLEKAKAAAAEKLRLAVLTAPCDGIVLEVAVDAGDSVGQMPLVRMADVRSMIAVAEVYETQVPQLAERQPVELTADALPRKLSGAVEHVGGTVGKNRLLSLDPTQAADAHVVEVRIRLDADSSAAAAKYVGLQTTAYIKTAP